MELRLCSPQEKGPITIIPLGIGDTIDDSRALDGLDYSGDTKKAMISLNEGNFMISLKPDISGFPEKTGKEISVDWSENMMSGKTVALSGVFDKLSYRFKEVFGVPSMKSSLTTITGRDVPVIETSNVGNTSGHETSTFLSQKEIFISPTVQVFNLLQTEILVVLTETYPDASIKDLGDIGKNAVIPYGSNAYFYANPSSLYFTITLTALNSKCKPVDTSECVKKLHKQKYEAHFFDIELAFNSGKHSVYLRLSCGDKGVLEATVFSSFTLQNNTELSLFCFTLSQKPLSQSNRVYLRLKEEKASESLLDLDTLSGFTELRFESSNEASVSRIVKVGVSLKACESKDFLPARMTDADGITQLEAKEKATLYMHPSRKRSTTSLFDSVCRKHRHIDEGSLVFIQFRLKETEYSWSGPICISSLGRFFIKFKKELTYSNSASNAITAVKSRMAQFASVHIVEESSTLVLHFHMPPDLTLPYRIENGLRGASITFYQKTLGAGDYVDYVLDDQNLPHKLVVQISGMQLLREINIDKISPWKPIFKARQNKLLALHFPVNRMSRSQKRNFDESEGLEFRRVGYEVYADGLTRVLRICEQGESYKEEAILQPRASFRFRMEHFAINLLEDDIQEQVTSLPQTVIVIRLVKFTLYSLSTDEDTYFCAKVEPFDLNLDEETLMKLAAFWRTSLSDSKMQSQLYYFKQFEIHPFKIRTCFLPGNPYSSYSSAQETLRSLLHTVIKVPELKNTVIELNGVLLNHALLTKRELLMKCANITLELVLFFLEVHQLSCENYLQVLTLFIIQMKKAGSSVLFAAITEISDSILKGAEADGFNGLVNGFHQGMMRLAMEPSLLGAAVMHGGPDRKIVLDQSPGVDELYIEGYLQAMLHVTYNQEYLQVKVIDNLLLSPASRIFCHPLRSSATKKGHDAMQVHLKNLPPNSALINEIVDNVKSFLVSQGLLKGDSSGTTRPLRHLRGETEWSVGPMVLTLCEHLFVSFAIRLLRARADELLRVVAVNARRKTAAGPPEHPPPIWAVGSFVLSGLLAYVDGWLCRRIPNPIVRRIVSGFFLTFLEKKDRS
ncbi:unnamed protein product [Spirodela intermedia]|uniref:Vacuolar protein sorting-associated protein 13 VPS13 adaptor binding domain-containing protein n=1 Tax=Spirodela intermedia TaxID=51605 RepID=A0A7I8IYK1_SPIIN|nr:unnamed protein product [Spirodela intermedia]CAA6663054.1 unnamed protein product [Spirodela intermedia]